MKLVIDTSDRLKAVVIFGKRKYMDSSIDNKSQILLPLIEKALKENGKNYSDLSQVEVATGPGSFTGLRVGVAVALALGYGLGIPVNGKSVLRDPVVVIKY